MWTLVLLAAQFTLRVESPVPARYYLDDANGNPHAPAGAVVLRTGRERHFVTRSGFQIALPAGAYTLAVERGPEFLPHRATVSGKDGETVTRKVELKRLIDMNRLGWYSGDLHNHRPAADVPLLLLAEHLNLTPVIGDWVWDGAQRAVSQVSGAPVRQVDATHVYSVFDKEVERLRDGPGAVDLLALKQRVPFTGYALYPPNDEFARQAHAQGGYVDAEKIVWRDIAALAALGHIDFAGIVHNHFNRHGVELETDRWGMIPKWKPEFNTPEGMPLWSMEVYYRFLNCGFRLPVSAGSAAGVKAAPLGHARVYVKQDSGGFSHDNWYRALKQGKSFATNGPMLFLTVDGKAPGGVVKQRRFRVQVRALSVNALDRVELLFKGRVIRSAAGPIDFTFETAESGWIAARAFDKPAGAVRFAHTSPVYIELPGDPGVVREDAQFFLDWIDREIAFYSKLEGFREPAHRDAMLKLLRDARAVYERIRRRGAGFQPAMPAFTP